MKKLLVVLCLAGIICSSVSPVLAEEKDSVWDNVTPKTVAGGALSLIIWPGIGQAMNSEKGEKVFAHAVVGLLPPFRFWSAYDALVDRKGGYWEGRI